MGGWLEIWRVKLISTQVVVEVEVGVELGNDAISVQIGVNLHISVKYAKN